MKKPPKNYPRSDIFEFPEGKSISVRGNNVDDARQHIRCLAESTGAEIADDRLINGKREIKVIFLNEMSDTIFTTARVSKPTRENVF